MIVHNVLDYVFATWSHIAVLRVLQDSATGLTGREIARLSRMNHRSCLKALTTLEQLSIVERERGGRDHRFLLNRSHVLVQRGVLPLLKVERNFLDDLTRVIVVGTEGYARAVILFGSAARREELLDSDLDVCFVIPKEPQAEDLLSLLQGLSATVQKKFGVRLAPLIMTSTDFAAKARSKKPPVADILKEGIVLHGRSLRELSRG